MCLSLKNAICKGEVVTKLRSDRGSHVALGGPPERGGRGTVGAIKLSSSQLLITRRYGYYVTLQRCIVVCIIITHYG